jgi:hypothetical protein
VYIPFWPFIPPFCEIITGIVFGGQVNRHVWLSKLLDCDISIAEWDKLPEYQKESNRQQADHIFDKLHRVGCTAHKVTNREIVLIEFTEEEIEIMAEMEHARWNDERLRNGWKLGERRDVTKKASPYLVPWPKLPADMKEWDRHTVRKIPEYLAKVGLEVRRQVSGSPTP